MSRIIVLLLGVFSCVFGAWGYQQELTLKRNELYEVKLLVGRGDERPLSFFWTLIADGGIVVLAKYNGFNQQTILWQEHSLNALKIYLDSSVMYQPPYVCIFFKSYDEKSKQATFLLTTFGDVYVR
ncbi:hypothetical protein BBW65_01025 [Helicobacter enhydrae]|uniref:Uncharacterized protein n=1 Tax=Helicobacter enhydrae TaxID=222136 RepID=A0A1B1U429_9HELI|nr:hypothetical protein [Helicobacter enhydrae]ANV97482.1 hypothetical protein BBW65_01025 [Helicobacter enhydrae]